MTVRSFVRAAYRHSLAQNAGPSRPPRATCTGVAHSQTAGNKADGADRHKYRSSNQGVCDRLLIRNVRCTKMPEKWGDSPIHDLDKGAWQYDIVRFDYNADPEDCANDFLDLILRKGHVTRRLRFLQPSGLKIEEGFPASTHGMIILDISHRQWDRKRIEVADFEASHGAVTFYADEVIEIGDT